jgi:hypothetical protein
VVKVTLSHPWLSQCLLDALSKVRFPVPQDARPVTVTWPFRRAER